MSRDAPPPPSRGKLLLATIAALLLAGAILVGVVLPAEYGVDPLGTGERLGLIVLSNPGATDTPLRQDGLIPQDEGYRVDRKVFEIEAGEFMEYKFRLAEGAAMVYSWSASAPLRAEMHSERDGAPAGTAEFFEILESALQGNGTYVAPFPGDHGWYWSNEGSEAVTLTLYAAGFFDDSVEYRPRADPFLRQMEETPQDLYVEESQPAGRPAEADAPR